MDGGEYIAYECKECHIVFIVSLDSLRVANLLGRYVSCPLGHRRVEKLNVYAGMKECMEQTYSKLI